MCWRDSARFNLPRAFNPAFFNLPIPPERDQSSCAQGWHNTNPDCSETHLYFSYSCLFFASWFVAFFLEMLYTGTSFLFLAFRFPFENTCSKMIAGCRLLFQIH